MGGAIVLIGVVEYTSITLTSKRKEELNEFREDNESWDAFFQRWLADDPPEKTTESRILEAIDQVPERTADKIERRLR